MKNKFTAAIVCAIILSIPAIGFGQQIIKDKTPVIIPAEPLGVTYSKTTNLLFPYAIKWFDVGSTDVLAQIAGSVKNLLQVKAAKQGFVETNLTVVTADGKFYSYLLNYTAFPSEINKKVGSNMNYPKADALFTNKSDNEATVYDITQQLAARKPVLTGIKDKSNHIGLTLDGVYIKDDKMYFQFSVENSSNIDYAVESLRFFIVDKKRSSRTSSQEVEQIALQTTGNTEVIRKQSKQSIVITLPRFTIPDKKMLSIRLMEENGGRHLQLKIQNKTVVAAKGL